MEAKLLERLVAVWPEDSEWRVTYSNGTLLFTHPKKFEVIMAADWDDVRNAAARTVIEDALKRRGFTRWRAAPSVHFPGSTRVRSPE